MFNTKVFPSFNSAKNSNQRDRAFLVDLLKTKNLTNASFVCFSIFDFTAKNPNQLNFVTYPMEWISHLITNFHGETDMLFDADFRDKPMFDWGNLDKKSNAAKLFENIRSFGLARNGMSISHPMADGKFGVLSLSFHTRDQEWPIQKAYNMRNYQAQAGRVTGRYETIYNNEISSYPLITQRETQCLNWVAQGMTDDQIARELGVTKWTVVTHLCNARRKLDSPNRASAVAIALSKGIITLQSG